MGLGHKRYQVRLTINFAILINFDKSTETDKKKTLMT